MLALHKVAKRSIQLYSVGTTTLWAYDYFLTVGDEVAVYRGNDAGKKLTTFV